MNEDTTNKQANDNDEAATERERQPSEERGNTEANRPNVAEEYLNSWKRERADFLNYKKDESRRMEEFVKYANEDLVLEIIEMVDDLEIVAKEAPSVGLEHVVKKFSELFKKYGVERIILEGQFNPALHEAVEIEKDGAKMVEVRAGYTMHGKVIRPARVKLIK